MKILRVREGLKEDGAEVVKKTFGLFQSDFFLSFVMVERRVHLKAQTGNKPIFSVNQARARYSPMGKSARHLPLLTQAAGPVSACLLLLGCRQRAQWHHPPSSSHLLNAAGVGEREEHVYCEGERGYYEEIGRPGNGNSPAAMGPLVAFRCCCVRLPGRRP